MISWIVTHASARDLTVDMKIVKKVTVRLFEVFFDHTDLQCFSLFENTSNVIHLNTLIHIIICDANRAFCAKSFCFLQLLYFCANTYALFAWAIWFRIKLQKNVPYLCKTNLSANAFVQWTSEQTLRNL